jgi:hypothetical protein
MFGIHSNYDCDVVISITRIGDADEVVPNEHVMTVSSSSKAFTTEFGSSDSLLLAPVDGSYDVVLGSDGYYHIGSKTGPVVYVQLKKAVTRYSDTYPISFSSDGSDEIFGWTRIYTISDSKDRVTDRYYYALPRE